MDSGQEQNYWPGFVDALSNVVLTLVFVLVIFVFALAMASNKVEEKMREVTQAEAASVKKQEKLQTDIEEIENLKAELAQAKAQLAAMNPEELGQSKQEDAGEKSLRETSQIVENKDIAVQEHEINPEEYEGSVSVKSDEGMLTLTFPNAISQIDEKSTVDLGTTISALKQTGGVNKILIKSIMGRETFSVAQRLAYYRAVNVRNILMTKLGMSSSAITSTIVKPESSGIGRVEIIFKK